MSDQWGSTPPSAPSEDSEDSKKSGGGLFGGKLSKTAEGSERPRTGSHKITSLLANFTTYLGLTGGKKGNPFKTLARMHSLSAMGDAMIILSLSNSLFFSIDPGAARGAIFLYLLLTIAPFAVVSPLIGPAIDRVAKTRRIVAIVINILRTLTAFLMITRLDSIFLFPLAFLVLVLGKAYSITKAALVPETSESEDEFVDKNSRLAVLSTVSGTVGIGIAFPFLIFLGSPPVVFMAFIVWGLGSFVSFLLPKVEPYEKSEAPDVEIEDKDKKPLWRSPVRVFLGKASRKLDSSVFPTTYAMASLRAMLGFLTFLIAFGFRGGTDKVDLGGIGKAVGAGVGTAFGYGPGEQSTESPLRLGLLAGAVLVGTFLGSFMAPKLRQVGKEERILLGALAVAGMAGVLAALVGDFSGGVIIGLFLGLAAGGGKVAFDSITQRDAPGAIYGRTFGGLEAFFQFMWVLGAFIPVILTIPPTLGFLVIGVNSLLTFLRYLQNRGLKGSSYKDLINRKASLDF